MKAFLSSKPKIGLMFVILLLSGGLILLWLYYPWQAEKVEITSQGNEQFGLAFISAPDNSADTARYEGALNVGVHWDRWPLYWHWVAEGGYVGSHEGGEHDYDTLILEEIEQGLQPLVILLGTPEDKASSLSLEDLAEADENADSISSAILPPISLNQPIFLDGTDDPDEGKEINPDNAWAAFVYATVMRYRPGGTLAQTHNWAEGLGVRHWEVWNEPDYDLFWRGTQAEYARLLEVAYKSIKVADPEATVVLGGIAFYEKPNWLTEFFRLALQDADQAYFDVLSIHHYWSIYNSEARLNDIQALLNFYGLSNIPIWVTESGVSVWDDYPATAYEVGPDTPLRGTMEEQAAYLVQHPALAFYHGVERYFHFMLHDDCGDGPSSAYGLRQNFSPHACNPAQGQARPAYAAYQLVTEKFRNLVPLWRQRTADIDQIAFYDPTNQARVLVLWATQGITSTAFITATGSQADLYWIDTASPVEIKTQTNRKQETLSPEQEVYQLVLPPATRQDATAPDNPDYHIGGRPVVLIEQDNVAPRSIVNSLPLTRASTFLVTWQGQDRGSGIASYDLWVGEDDEEFVPWLTDTTSTQAEYQGEAGHTYRFAVRARDRAGNEEAIPTEAQALTEVLEAKVSVSGVVLGPNGQAVPNAVVIFAENGIDKQRTVRPTEDGVWTTSPLLLGGYDFQVGAFGYGQWPAPRSLQLEETEASLLLTMPPRENVILSGDFEGRRVWRHWGWAGQVDRYFQAFDGQYAARLGSGQGEDITCPDSGKKGQRWFIQQAVTVPDTDQSWLSFVYKVETEQADSNTAWLEVSLVQDNNRYLLIPAGELWQAQDWTLTALNLSHWRDQNLAVHFRVVHCGVQSFVVTLDRVSLGVVE